MSRQTQCGSFQFVEIAKSNRGRRDPAPFRVFYGPLRAILLPRCHLLSAERQIVRDHRDALRIRRFALHVADRVAEDALERFDIAAVPGDLDGVADFRDFRPEIGDALRRIVEGSQPLDSLAYS